MCDQNAGNANTVIVSENINKKNIIYSVLPFELLETSFSHMIKDAVLKAFVRPRSPLRIVIATIAFGMGVDTPDISYVIHWGPPEDIEQYVQATRRAGRDGNNSHAVMLYSKDMLMM